MQAYFIRHNFTGKSSVVEQLWHDRRIAIHFDDIWSIEPKDYSSKSAKTALRRLRDCCKSGAVVGGVYRPARSSVMLVGEVEPGSVVESLEYVDTATVKTHIYKTVQLSRAKEVSYADYPLLAGIQPRLVTITGWPSARPYLLAILNETPLPRDVASLHPSQLEVLCYEYLRSQGLMESLLLPIGRNMLDIDIVGIRESDTVMAQVTHSVRPKVVQEKLERLQRYSQDSHLLYFFGPSAMKADVHGVTFVGIEHVFQHLDESGNASQREMLSRMLQGSAVS